MKSSFSVPRKDFLWWFLSERIKFILYCFVRLQSKRSYREFFFFCSCTKWWLSKFLSTQRSLSLCLTKKWRFIHWYTLLSRVKQKLLFIEMASFKNKNSYQKKKKEEKGKNSKKWKKFFFWEQVLSVCVKSFQRFIVPEYS